MKGPVRIPVAPDLAETLGSEAERRGVTAEALADAALRAHLEGELEGRRDAALLAVMEEILDALGRVTRANLVISETQAEHLRCFLTLAPPMRPVEADAARANGNLLFDGICGHIQSRIAGGPTFLGTVSAAAWPSESGDGGAPARGKKTGGNGDASRGRAADGDGRDALAVRFREAEKRIRRIERELFIMAELQACHLQHVLARSPVLHRDEEAMHREMGRERFRHVLRRLRDAVRGERAFLLGVLDMVRPTGEEFAEVPGGGNAVPARQDG